MLRIGFLECEDLGEYLSRPLYENYGGYYKMNCGRAPTQLLGVDACGVHCSVCVLQTCSITLPSSRPRL